MKTKIIIIITLIFTFFSCKNENKNVDNPQLSTKDFFKVSLDLIIKKDDSLQLFYLENDMVDYDGNKMVLAVVKGSDNNQEVNFVLPENVLPTQIRIDIGSNKNQEIIEFKKFGMNYLNKSFSVNDTLIYQYFQPNEQVEWNRKNASAKTIVKEGVFYDPGMSGREVLIDELKKIIK
jgi:hypothetical protein